MKLTERTKKWIRLSAIIGGVLIAVVPIRPYPGDPPSVPRKVFEEELLKIADQSARYPNLWDHSHEEVAHVHAFTVRGIRGRSLMGADIFVGRATTHAFGIAPKVLLKDLHEHEGRFFATSSDIALLREIWTATEWNPPAQVIP